MAKRQWQLYPPQQAPSLLPSLSIGSGFGAEDMSLISPYCFVFIGKIGYHISKSMPKMQTEFYLTMSLSLRCVFKSLLWYRYEMT